MVELRLGAYAYCFEYPGYPLLFFGRDRALALAAMIVIAFAREASHHAMAHGEKQLGGYFVEKMRHTAGIVQLLAGAVTGTSGGPGQAADIKRIHRTNGLWLGASLSDNSCAAIARRQEEALGHFPLPAKQYSYPSGTSCNNIILLMING